MKKRIFLGSSQEALKVLDEIALILEDCGCEPIRWNEPGRFEAGEYTFDNLIRITSEIDGAIFIFAEDDKSWYKNREIHRPRDNVLMEYGIFASALGRHNVIVVLHKSPHEPSDIAGITHIDASRIERARTEIKLWVSRLGLGINVPSISGRWLYEGGSSNNSYHVQGECTIEQMGRQLTFWGNRWNTLKDGIKVNNQNYTWRSSWARICTADNRIRVEYQIHRDAWHDGFVNVGFQDEKPDVLQGTFFFHLPPDTVSGNIQFKRAIALIKDDISNEIIS